MKKLIVAFLVCSQVLTGCAGRSASRQGETLLLTPPSEKEIQLGKEIHDQILSDFYLYTEPALNEYVRNVGFQVAKNADRKLPYRFTVLVSEKIYATSAPGGYVYITTGFLNYLQSEGELAAVLAHEVGQLQYKDPRLSAMKPAMEGLEVVAAIASGFFGPLGVLGFLGFHGLNTLIFKGKSKTAKGVSADTLALNYLLESEYDPQALVDVLMRLPMSDAQQDLYLIYDYYESRPIDQNRVQKLESAFGELDFADQQLENYPQRYQEATKGVRQMYLAARP